MTDIGFTHVALPVTDLDATIAFYAKYANMEAVHRRTDPKTGEKVAWLTDHTRPFVIVLLQEPDVEHKLLPPAHLGVACGSREEVDRLCELARQDGCLNNGPADAGEPIGYWAFVESPDGHILELTYGQEVALRVQETAKEKQPAESSV
jgi:catechol 2,3-dioxygenase-like lactoylglutathione lyase family enzyme